MFAQVIVVVVPGVLAFFATMRPREWRMVVVGATFLPLSLIGLRALH